MANVKIIQERGSPFFNVYNEQKDLINSAIEQSINIGAEKIDADSAKRLFSIKDKELRISKAA